jgi:hypothetical protein
VRLTLLSCTNSLNWKEEEEEEEEENKRRRRRRRRKEEEKKTIILLSLAVTLHTTSFNIEKFYVVSTLRLCVLYGSQNKQ